MGSPEELRTVATHIGATLRNEYLIGYSPSAMERDGKYHRVTVVVEGARDLKLFWKLGYYAPGELVSMARHAEPFEPKIERVRFLSHHSYCKGSIVDLAVALGPNPMSHRS